MRFLLVCTYFLAFSFVAPVVLPAQGAPTDSCRGPNLWFNGDFEQSDELDNATEEWKKIFGNDFPKQESSSNKEVNSSEQLSFLQTVA